MSWRTWITLNGARDKSRWYTPTNSKPKHIIIQIFYCTNLLEIISPNRMKARVTSLAKLEIVFTIIHLNRSGLECTPATQCWTSACNRPSIILFLFVILLMIIIHAVCSFFRGFDFHFSLIISISLSTVCEWCVCVRNFQTLHFL